MIWKVLNGAGIRILWLLGGLALASGVAPALKWDFDDYLLAPLRVHLLSGPEAPQFSTTLTGDDVARILGKINRVWAQAGIQFYLEDLVREAPRNAASFPDPERWVDFRWMLALRPVESQTNSTFHVYYVKQMRGNGVYLGEAMFVKDTASLKSVPGGVDEPIPRVSSHEIGHALGLEHRQNVTNLMASGTTGTWLNEEEILRAREAARRFAWIEPASQIMKRIQELDREQHTAEAVTWRRRLAVLPVPPAVIDTAPRRAP